MGNVNFGVDPIKTIDLQRKYNLWAFVETGLWKGGTALWACRNFEQVVSIEGDSDRYNKTLAGLDSAFPANLTLIEGDSRVRLARVLEEIDAPCLLWLDAHWCGGGAEAAHALKDECPLREEIAAVLASKYASGHILMIDDARLFTSPPPYPHDPTQWPTYDEIRALLAPRRVYIENDVIYAEPD